MRPAKGLILPGGLSRSPPCCKLFLEKFLRKNYAGSCKSMQGIRSRNLWEPGRTAAGILIILLIVLSGLFALVSPTPPEARAFSSFSNARWIIASGALNMVQELDPALASQFWNNNLSNVQGNAEPPVNTVPAGWSSIADQSYTADGSCGSASGCRSFTSDLNSGVISKASIPATPSAEIQAPCSSMQQFGQTAASNGFTPIVAPAQDLVSALTSSLGGEAKQWQEFLRLGLPACATQAANRYHIQAQSDELTEADYDAFVIQAALQARAANPSVIVTAGLSTNPPAGVPTPQQLYQDSIDVSSNTDGFWLNVPTPGSSCGSCSAARPDNAVQYLELADGMLPFYPHSGGSLDTIYPASTTTSSFSLEAIGSQLTWTTAETLPAGTVIPAGTYTFQDFTDGTSGSSSATVNISFGYCSGTGCTNRASIVGSGAWNPVVNAGDAGSTSTYTTSSATTLPSGGPYGLYTTVTVQSAGSFNLDYDSTTTETNLAIPRPSALPAPSAQSPVLFLHQGSGLDASMPTGQATTMSLATSGASQTWVSSANYPAGTVIPGGRYLFQAWTDGTRGAATAQLGLEFGYCLASDCAANKHAIVRSSRWDPTVTSGSLGDQLDPNGLSSVSTSTATTLPSGGPYELYFTVSVLSPGSFNLLFDSANAPTNLATPFLQGVTSSTPAPTVTPLTSTPTLATTATSGVTPTPTVSATPTPAPTLGITPTVGVTPTPTVSETSCSVHYAITNQWQGGFGASFTITNTGTTIINGWTLQFSFANGQTITQGWNGTFSQDGSVVTVTSLSYNGTVPVGGSPGSEPGFNGSWTATNSAPTAFTLNGAACTVV
jgi:hypothetical protein